MNLRYYANRVLKKLSGRAISHSVIHKTSRIEAGSQVVETEMDRYSYCGYDCELLNCRIGAFCSIATGVVIGGRQHPIDWASTSPVFNAGRNCLKKNFSAFPRADDPVTTIGNDVWIGERVMIKGGVTIGDGAIIGMGSVVTKDIGPYEIWAGNPARHIRDRFDDDTTERLKDSRWWEWSDAKIQARAEHIKDPARFIDEVLT